MSFILQYYMSALLVAARLGYTSIAKTLIEGGAELESIVSIIMLFLAHISYLLIKIAIL